MVSFHHESRIAASGGWMSYEPDSFLYGIIKENMHFVSVKIWIALKNIN